MLFFSDQILLLRDRTRSCNREFVESQSGGERRLPTPSEGKSQTRRTVSSMADVCSLHPAKFQKP